MMCSACLCIFILKKWQLQWMKSALLTSVDPSELDFNVLETMVVQ